MRTDVVQCPTDSPFRRPTGGARTESKRTFGVPNSGLRFAPHRVVPCAALVAIVLCAGCGDDDGVVDLSGTWFGAIENPNVPLALGTVQMEVSGDQVMTVVSSGIDRNVVGTIEFVRGRFHRIGFIDLVNGDEWNAGLIVSGDGAHAVLLDDVFNIGPIERDATSLPVYSLSDFDMTASGVVVTLTDDFEVNETGGSRVTCSNRPNIPTCAGTDIFGEFNATFSVVDGSFGRWIGTFNRTGGDAAAGTDDSTTTVLLSPDRRFAAGWACRPNGTAFFAGCSLYGWDIN